MKIKLLLIWLWCGLMHSIQAQAIVLGEGFSNRSVDLNDSIIVISALGSVFEEYSFQDDIVVTSEPIFPIQINTATKELTPIEGLRIFPNPVTDMLVFQRSSRNEDYSIEVFQSTGQSIRKMKWDKGAETLEMPFASFIPEVYFITVTNQALNQSSTYKIYKK